MCGIAGILEWGDAGLDPVWLDRMTGVLGHRGPEQQATRLLGDASIRVGLGHTRLKIIDRSDAAGQPMASEDEMVWLVFNGEIYNYRELRLQLQQRGVRFRTTSDTEVLLRMYEVEGSDCVKRLEGMFAFAIWDARRRSMLLGRDRVGKKPLFYASAPGRFVFASEIKALLQHPAIEPDVHEAVLPAFFLHGYAPNPQTLYRGILGLPAGHVATVGPERAVELASYWDVPFAPPTWAADPSEEEAAAGIRRLLTAAVRRRLVADVPVGAFLSGGLDSSIVVGVMSRLMREPVRTFSIGFPGQSHFDETPYARLAARRFGTVHTEFAVEPESVALVERLVWHHDGPFGDSSAIPTYLLAQQTRRHVTVALNGDGGDELFAGYLRFWAALLAERLPGWARTGIRHALAGLPPVGGMRDPVRRMQKFASGVSQPLIDRVNRWAGVFHEDLPKLLPGCQGDGLTSRAFEPIEPHVRRAAQGSALSQLLYLNLKTYLADDLLVKMDRCCMAHALEARSPFLDRELVEYVFALPDEMKVGRGRTKRILRRAFADLVPAEILRRGKMGFGVPLEAWFASDVRDYLHDILLAPDARLRQYVDQAYVRQLLEAHVRGRTDASHRLWTVLTFEVWLRNLPRWAASAGPERVAASMAA